MRVLAVEDDPGVAKAIRRALEGDGIAVDLVDDGRDALWKASEQVYDAIVLDIMLPGMNGFSICRELRRANVMTPILFLTAKRGELDHVEGLDLGGDDFMTKPFSLVIFLARIRAMIRRGPAARPAVLRIGDLELDPSTRRCTRAGRPVELTLREYSLLRYLMMRSGEIVSKEELVAQVWNDEFRDPSIVRVYIGYLRKKIDEPFDEQLLHNVRGHGYWMGTAPIKA